MIPQMTNIDCWYFDLLKQFVWNNLQELEEGLCVVKKSVTNKKSNKTTTTYTQKL